MNKLDLDGIGMTSKRTRLRLVDRLRAQGIRNEDLLEVITEMPRHIFVDEALAHRAYEDKALPIGHNQTISQPYVVARMTEALLKCGPLKRVLEVGTGSGYQVAVLSQLADRVFSVERIHALYEKARDRMKLLRIRNVQLRCADGVLGWPERGPFDGIIVTASPRQVPPELLSQLSTDGRMIIPIGDDEVQELRLITKTAEGFRTEVLDTVRFVPMVAGSVN